MIKQIYRVKKDGRLNKNSDLTQDKEKPIVEEISASSVDKIVPDIEHVSNDMAEQQSSSAGGQDKKKNIGDNSTGLTSSQMGLTSMPTGLSGTQTGLTSVSSEPKNYSTTSKKIRLSFEELLVKYENKGAIRKQKSRSYSTRDASSLPRHQEQQGSRQQQGN